MATPEQPPPAAPFLTALAAAERLGVAERTIRRAIARGDLPAVKRAGSFQIALADLERYRHSRARSGGVAQPATPSHQAVPLAGPPAAGPGALPISLTSLVGREREIAALVTALRGPDRLVTLTGPGGVGKTRLAVAPAPAPAADFADGVGYVGLTAISDPRLVAQTIAHVLGVPETGGEPIPSRLLSALRDRRLLLVLDNVEHLVEAAPLFPALIAACPHLKLMVTSRVRLRISGEHEYPVIPLQVSGAEDRASHAAPSPAARLFAERAQAVRRDADLSPEVMATVEAICHRLDGLPLAIELAAAWVNVLSAGDLLSRLEKRLLLLSGGPRDVPARLRTMRDAIAWSYDLLTPEEQALFRRLAVFTGGFTLDAAERVLGIEDRRRASPPPKTHHPLPPDDTLDLVAALVDKSLLQTEFVADGTTRYAMLETIREFGLERLASSGQEVAARQRHAEWALGLAERTEPLMKGPDVDLWLEALEQDHANLRAALIWFVERRAGDKLARLAGALWPFWEQRAYYAEGRSWLETALEVGQTASASDRLSLLAGAGTLAWRLSDFAQATRYHEQTLTLARDLGDRAAEAFALNNLGAQAKELADYGRATAYYNASLAISRAIGAPETTLMALHNLAQVQRLQRDSAAALRSMEEVLALVRDHAMSWLLPSALAGLGLAATDQGDHARASAAFHEALSLAVARRNKGNTIDLIECLARLVGMTGHAAEAARLFGAGEALRAGLLYPVSPADRAYTEPVLRKLRETLGADGFAAAWAAGRQLSWDEAVAAALDLCDASRPQRPAVHELTTREIEVLRHLAQGKRNRAIAAALFISPTTVESHVANIFGKLGVDSRVEAIAFAHRHDLV
jgi:excisionase family DNA binding protein